jgi:hypothetical protein
MCDNLIFTNIPEIDEYESPEETENLVKIFVSDILQIVENFELHVAHRSPSINNEFVCCKFDFSSQSLFPLEDGP